MALFLEDSQKVIQKKITIPQNAKKVFKAMEKIYKPYLDKAEGGHVLKSLASDKHYNNKGDNADNNGEEKKIDTISVDDAKVRLHRMDKFSPNSVQYQMYGGELAKNIYKDGIERARSVSTVDAVKPPKPTSNAEVKPAVVKTKEISTPNGKISYTVTSENKKPKKIYISEEAIKTLYEDYRQLKIPFKNNSGKGYDYKENYELFIDWLESIGKYGRLGPYTGDKSYEEMIDNLIEPAYVEYMDEWDGAADFIFIFDDLFVDSRNDGTIEDYFILPDKIINNADEIDNLSEKLNLGGDISDVYDYLTDEGKEIFREESFELFKNIVHNGPYYLELDDRGLIYVEREISVPNLLGTQFDATRSPEEKDFFNYLKGIYDGIGVCWSWKKEGGEAYNAIGFGNIKTDYITLRGWVGPESVDWIATMTINAQMGNAEKELRLHKGAIVEVDEIIITGYDVDKNIKGKNILNNPILIPA